jgi:hypothetical protein
MADIDEKTAEYVLAHRTHFEDLRQAVAQVAGVLVLAATGAAEAAPDHPLLEIANRLVQTAVDGFRGAHVPLRARPHHDAVLRAASAVGGALDAARTGLGRRGQRVDIDSMLTPLRAAYAHLQAAAHALPGF